MVDFWINLSAGLRASLIITAFIGIVLIIVGARVSRLKTSEVPGGFTLVIVTLVEMINNNQREFFTKHWSKFTPLLLTIVIYLGFANTAALAGLNAPLSNLNVALSFSAFAFLSIQISALVLRGPLTRAKDLMDPHPAFLAINLIGEMSTPFAMGLRLFGNLVSGSIIAIFLYAVLGALSNVLAIIGGVFLHGIFDIFFGLVQAYVYYMLLTIFLSMAVEE